MKSVRALNVLRENSTNSFGIFSKVAKKCSTLAFLHLCLSDLLLQLFDLGLKGVGVAFCSKAMWVFLYMFC